MMLRTERMRSEACIVTWISRHLAIGLALALSGTLGCHSSTPGDSAMHAGPVMNYHRIDARLLTGGHLVGDGIDVLAKEGVAVVIDLRDKPVADEVQAYADRGIDWINVPVVWSNPTSADFAQFVETMRAHEGEHVFVQCAANYRASAFTYLYRRLVRGVDVDDARADLHAVWIPEAENEQWSRYITHIENGAR